MIVKDIVTLLDAHYVNDSGLENENYDAAFASDLMSDVLTIDMPNVLLITGLANIQTIRTADMADIKCIVLGRNKRATPEMIELAKENEITIIECAYSLFHICGLLYNEGIDPLY